MKILIDKQYMLHEGGTKFYQVLRIKAPVDKTALGTGRVASTTAVTITHWGPQKGSPGLQRIVKGGQHKVVSADMYASTVRSKRDRGYKDDTAWGSTNVLDEESKLRIYLNEELGSKEASDVLMLLGFNKSEKVDPSDSADTSSARSASRAATAPEAPSAAASMDEWGEF